MIVSLKNFLVVLIITRRMT